MYCGEPNPMVSSGNHPSTKFYSTFLSPPASPVVIDEAKVNTNDEFGLNRLTRMYDQLEHVHQWWEYLHKQSGGDIFMPEWELKDITNILNVAKRTLPKRMTKDMDYNSSAPHAYMHPALGDMFSIVNGVRCLSLRFIVNGDKSSPDYGKVSNQNPLQFLLMSIAISHLERHMKGEDAPIRMVMPIVVHAMWCEDKSISVPVRVHTYALAIECTLDEDSTIPCFKSLFYDPITNDKQAYETRESIRGMLMLELAINGGITVKTEKSYYPYTTDDNTCLIAAVMWLHAQAMGVKSIDYGLIFTESNCSDPDLCLRYSRTIARAIDKEYYTLLDVTNTHTHTYTPPHRHMIHLSFCLHQQTCHINKQSHHNTQVKLPEGSQSPSPPPPPPSSPRQHTNKRKREVVDLTGEDEEEEEEEEAPCVINKKNTGALLMDDSDEEEEEDL
jgi:hypothetical protein